jgi:5-bromo-4-chloroindolyl phosphate hydrolysis protein
MTVDVFSAFLSYITIPIYVFGLLLLVYIIARSQLGFSFSRQIKSAAKTGLARKEQQKRKGLKRSGAPMITYLLVFLLFALFTALTIITQREHKL